MHHLEKAIITVFSERPSAILATSELVGIVLPEALLRLRSLGALEEKRERAKLHRKLLYHLQKLVHTGVLEVVGVRGRGEKRYALVSGEVIIHNKGTQVVINKPVSLETPIDSLPGVVGVGRESWLSKVNALALEGSSFRDLYEACEGVRGCSAFVNDAIGLLRFESLLGTGDAEEFLDSLRQIPCKISLIISLAFVTDPRKVARFCRAYSLHRPSNVQIVFSVSSRLLNEHQELLCEIIRLFMKRTIKINFKNNNVCRAPVICGLAGAYSLEENDWLSYKETRRNGVVLCGASAIVDVVKGRVHVLGKEAARALFLVARKRTEVLAALEKRGFETSYLLDLVRIWNYDLSSETLIEELTSTREVVQDFCVLQERIYRACGLPVRSRIRLSSAFSRSYSLSARAYKKVRVTGMSSLQKGEHTVALSRRESLCRLFCADRVRVFRYGRDEDALEVFREVAFILNTYALPYITYDFSELRGDVKLTEFLGGGSL